MMLIFAFSITPKIILHDLVTDHKDISPHSPGNSVQVTKSGFHCDRESLVVVLPYLNYKVSIHLDIFKAFRIYQTGAGYQSYSCPHFIFGLRGPPAVA